MSTEDDRQGLIVAHAAYLKANADIDPVTLRYEAVVTLRYGMLIPPTSGSTSPAPPIRDKITGASSGIITARESGQRVPMECDRGRCAGPPGRRLGRLHA